ncbi:conserved hypothetical protein [Streptomyces himastatinicus ATCC 53653]|uniref:Methyltransferase domain-containing protein n=2 Tax=Streptomyces violaceusniger group TaxID=2839105 RepID=D9WST0_9ACTN|nr:conserved hypothetical protein [Streptomyces himastatinicus ATCC 53653]
MDLALLDELTDPRWTSVRRAADLGCGTGRTATWLRRNGVPAIDGVDLTPEMLDRARARGVHDRLIEPRAAVHRSSETSGAGQDISRTGRSPRTR